MGEFRAQRNRIIYQFSRSKVERGDFRHFLSLYNSPPDESCGR